MSNQENVLSEEIVKLKRQRNMFFIQGVIGWLMALVVMIGYNSRF